MFTISHLLVRWTACLDRLGPQHFLKLSLQSTASALYSGEDGEQLWEESIFLGPSPQEIWGRRFHPESISNAFLPHYTGEIWKRNMALDLCLRKTRPQKSHDDRFPSTLKRKPGVFKLLRFEKRFQKAPLSWLLSVDGRPDCRNKNSNFSVVKWTGHSQRSSPLTPNAEAT